MNGMDKLQARVAKKRGGKLWRSVEAFAELIDYPLDDFQVSLIVICIQKRSVIHLSAMRKIGKTHILGFLLLFLGFLGYTGVYTNHRKEYVEEVFLHCLPYAEELKQLGIIYRIEKSHQHLNLFFAPKADPKNPSKKLPAAAIKFRTRSASFGRGGMKLDFVFFDEAHKLHEDTQTDISGTMKPSKLNLEVHVGNPPTESDLDSYPDSPFVAAKRRMLEGKKVPNWIEFSAADRYDEDLKLTPELLLECNPNAHRLGDLGKLIASEMENGKRHEVIAAELFGVWNLPDTFDKIQPEFTGREIDGMLTSHISKASKWYLSVAIDYKSSLAYLVINDGVLMELAETLELDRGSVEPVAEWIIAQKNRFKNIFIYGNAKGKQLEKLLSSIPNRWENVDPGAFAVSLSRWMNQVANGSLLINDTDDVRAALGSFWISYDAKTAAPWAQSSSPEHTSLLMSMMIGALDKKTMDRIAGSVTASPQAQLEDRFRQSETAVATAPEPQEPIVDGIQKPEVPRMDPMAIKKQAMAEEKARRLEAASAKEAAS